MKLTILFTEEERRQVDALVMVAKRLFNGGRVHAKSRTKDGRNQLEMKTGN